MPVYLEPYQANPALIRRVYPLVPYQDMVAHRANLARAYASASVTADCAKAGQCSCCKKPSSIYYTFKGPSGTVNGKDCKTAEASYHKLHSDCNAVSVDLDMGTGQITDTNPGVFKPGDKGFTKQSKGDAKAKAGAGGGKDVGLSITKSKGEGKGKAGAGGGAESGGTQPTDTTDTTSTDTGVTPSTDTAGTPQDLFAKFPSVSNFFNSIFTKVCGAKIPFVCQSLAYFEITVIAVAILLLVLLFGKKHR